VEYYHKPFDRLSVKTKVPLERVEKTFFRVTTTDDPIIKELSLKEDFDGNVFGTDAILATMMACSRSVYSWDIIARRVGSKLLFFDKRDNSQFDYVTVNETATEPPREDDKDSINSPQKLSQEATYINENFSQQLLGKEKGRYNVGEPNPFQGSLTDDEVASVGYVYKKFDMGNGNVLVCRCEFDAVASSGKDKFLTIKALNEYDPKATGVDWKLKLDSQRGSVLATELKNNSSKLAKWTIQSILAGTNQIKLGYVSRTTPKSTNSHQILGVQTYKPLEFAQQINLNLNNMWGIMKHIIDVCMNLEEGTYVLMKDPNKPILRLYEIQGDTLDDEKKDGEEEGVE